jgi:hypothetical protein
MAMQLPGRWLVFQGFLQDSMVYAFRIAGITASNFRGRGCRLNSMSALYSPHSSFQRYRIRVIEQGPRSEYQQAALQAAHAALLKDQAFESAAAGAGSHGK